MKNRRSMDGSPPMGPATRICSAAEVSPVRHVRLPRADNCPNPACGSDTQVGLSTRGKH